MSKINAREGKKIKSESQCAYRKTQTVLNKITKEIRYLLNAKYFL